VREEEQQPPQPMAGVQGAGPGAAGPPEVQEHEGEAPEEPGGVEGGAEGGEAGARAGCVPSGEGARGPGRWLLPHGSQGWPEGGWQALPRASCCLLGGACPGASERAAALRRFVGAGGDEAMEDEGAWEEDGPADNGDEEGEDYVCTEAGGL